MTDLLETTEDGVAWLTLNRPDRLNAFSPAMLQGLGQALQRLRRDASVGAVIITGAGRGFCAGGDVKTMPARAAEGFEERVEGLRRMHQLPMQLRTMPKVVIAMVNGPAVGAGLGLALVSDFRVAAPEARFVANFIKLNFHPGFGLTHTLPRLIGQQRASLMFLTGRRIKAEEGLAWGLVDELVPAQELRPAALRLAAEIAANGPLALVATRNTLRGKLGAEVSAQLDDVEYPEQTRLRETEDFQEGVRSVAERRPGNFVGR